MKSSMAQHKVAIIGAGISGLTSIKACLEEDLLPVCFESTGDLGGLWRYTENIEKKGSIMKSTIINTSKEFMAFSDYPPDESLPNFMSHEKVMQYIRGYVDQFDLEKYIRYHTEVLKAIYRDDKWLIRTKHNDKESEELYDALMVCVGHHSIPNMPHFEGLDSFNGKVWHTHDIRNPYSQEFWDQNCLIIGVGNSGLDAAVEMSSVANNVYLSTRSGAWVAHRVGDNGTPLDLTLSRLMFTIGQFLGINIMNKIIMKRFNDRFDHSKYSLKPNCGPMQHHVTICDALPNRILSGKVIIKPDVKRFVPSTNPDSEGGSVEFDDGTVVENVSRVILGTGYRMNFPFLESSVIEVIDNQLPLYKFVFPTHMGNHPPIAFIGYIQPIGAILPLSELQARWAVRIFKRLTSLPDRETMNNLVEFSRREMSQRYHTSIRHTIQVDYLPYADSLAEEVGCKPDLLKLATSDPKLAYQVLFGPVTSYQYRLFGPHPWPQARETIFTQWQRVLKPLQTRKTVETHSSSIQFYMVIIFCLLSILLYYFLKC